MKLIEVRRDLQTRSCPEGDIDEICGKGEFHLERMEDSVFALMLYGDAGDTMCVWLTPKRWSKKNGQAPHIKAAVSWHDKPESVPAGATPLEEGATESAHRSSSSSLRPPAAPEGE